jgi:hypothetical protein
VLGPLNRPSQEPVYHYCSEEGLLGILQSRCIWLTNHHAMNDPSEGKLAGQLLNDFEDRFRTTGQIQVFARLKEQLKHCLGDTYLASFSADGDVLSQWRAYADNGRGFALGFDALTFEGVRNQFPKGDGTKENSLGMSGVIYDTTAQRNLISDLVEELIEANGEESKLQEATGLMNWFACVFKASGFREEKEWRIMYKPLVPLAIPRGGFKAFGALEPVHFRRTKFGIIPYFKMPLDMTKNPLLEIIKGPMNPAIAGVIEMFALSQGFQGVRVRKSAIELR